MGPSFAPFHAPASPGTAALRARAGIAFAVVAVHVAVLLMMGGVVRHAAAVVEITLLPVRTPPEARPHRPAPAQEVPIPRTAASRSFATTSARKAPRNPRPGETQAQGALSESQSELPNDSRYPVSKGNIDWHDEASASARLQEQRTRESARRSLAAHQGSPLTPDRKVPQCPFEACEPGWGAGPSVFESNKAGRIEKTDDGETIRWTSNHCYQILVAHNPLHRGMSRCTASLEKRSARGDLFKHMKEAAPPGARATEIP